ncbi:MAG: ATP-dependent protease subunit HslV, partial [Bacilli bacterium]
QRAAVELAKEWRTNKMMRNLEALLIVMNKEHLFLVSGNGEVIEPDDGMIAIGSGGSFALAAGRAMKRYAPHLTAREVAEGALRVAAEICVFTNENLVIEEIK